MGIEIANLALEVGGGEGGREGGRPASNWGCFGGFSTSNFGFFKTLFNLGV